MCQKYYEKNFNIDVQPVNGVTSGRMEFVNFSVSAIDTPINIQFKVMKRIAPTMTSYNSVGSTDTGQFDNFGQYGGVMFINNLSAGTVDFHHWTADAEF